jgi:hypothetical protein
MTHQINSEEWRFNTNKHGGSREFRFDAYISSRITTVIQVVRDYQINYNWYNEPSAVSIKYLILTHAWLNLWDERMTTGRINQVATCTRGFNRSQGRISSSLLWRARRIRVFYSAFVTNWTCVQAFNVPWDKSPEAVSKHIGWLSSFTMLVHWLPWVHHLTKGSSAKLPSFAV